MNNKKKKIIIALLLTTLLAYSSVDYNYTSNYQILDDDKAYAKYSKGKVYIGNGYFLSHLEDLDYYDVLVEDLRLSSDPDMKVYDSSKFKDKDMRKEIIEVLLEYEKDNPSRWNRSIDSMKVEWFLHNIFYHFNFQRKRTEHVDFNNKDEKQYDNKIIRKVLKL